MKMIIAIMAFCVSTVASVSVAESPDKFVVHEWGTFTSVQGGDGVLLSWQPFTAQDLPAFVHNLRRPGLGRAMPAVFQFDKGGIRSLQRMETPVIYFYSGREMAADVTVKFPNGLITEWYPQAQNLAYKKAQGFTGMLFGGPNMADSLKDSSISWRGIKLVPQTSSANKSSPLPGDGGTNHYFAARETDSAFVHVARGGTNGDTAEVEKLLFYRGAGNFATPLKVTVSDDGDMAVQNTGDTPLAGLFLLQIKNGEGTWTHLDGLAAHGSRKWQRLGESNPNTTEQGKFRKDIAAGLESSLVAAGLYPREAAAMVKTWSDSWFAEDGVRVLYILPRQWTDATLPMTLKPRPAELVRVMVGRAEIIPPTTAREIAATLQPASKGDVVAQKQLDEYSHRLGRFYGPAWQLADNLVKKTAR